MVHVRLHLLCYVGDTFLIIGSDAFPTSGVAIPTRVVIERIELPFLIIERPHR